MCWQVHLLFFCAWRCSCSKCLLRALRARARARAWLSAPGGTQPPGVQPHVPRWATGAATLPVCAQMLGLVSPMAAMSNAYGTGLTDWSTASLWGKVALFAFGAWAGESGNVSGSCGREGGALCPTLDRAGPCQADARTD